MGEPILCKHELRVEQCYWCKPKPPPVPVESIFETPDDVGPWFMAAYDSDCQTCGASLLAGSDEIRFVNGVIECRECTDDDN